MAKRARRLNLFLPEDLLDQLELYSEKYGIPRAHLVSMAVRAGLGSIIRSISPEDILTPDLIRKFGEVKNEEMETAARTANGSGSSK